MLKAASWIRGRNDNVLRCRFVFRKEVYAFKSTNSIFLSKSRGRTQKEVSKFPALVD